MPSTNVPLEGFSELDAIVTIAPIFEGDSLPVEFKLVSGDFAIHNSLYTIDGDGKLFIGSAPSTPQKHFVRYNITVSSNPCSFIEDYILINWTDKDYSPEVYKFIDTGSLDNELSINTASSQVATITNMVDLPVNRSIVLQATWQNDNPLFVASLFTVDEQTGIITVDDYYSIREDSLYRFQVVVTDLDTRSTYHSDLCLGPFLKQAEVPRSSVLSDGQCYNLNITTTPAPTTTSRPLDCQVLQPYYPLGLTDSEIDYYESSCLGLEPDAPTFSVVYELATTEVLEARSYTLVMSGLVGINSPQVLNFAKGDEGLTLDLNGTVSQVHAQRTASSLILRFTIDGEADALFSVDFGIRSVDGVQTDPLLDTFTVSLGVGDFTYSLRSEQSFSFSDDHGPHVKHNNACYERMGALLNNNPDWSFVPDGGTHTSKIECLGG